MSPTIRVDDEVYASLQARAVAFIDTPNSVLRRVLGLADEVVGEVDVNGQGAAAESPAPSPPGTKARVRRSRQPKRKRAATGTILPEQEYELPLLRILEARGGSAPAADAIEELGKVLNGKLMPNDHERLASGRIRWQNRAQFVRLRLVERGDMAKDSARGVWAISDQGRARLAQE